MKKFKFRDKYKKYNNMRKNPQKYIPFHQFYCYGVFQNNCDKKFNHNCPFLIDDKLDYHLQCFRNKLTKDRYMMEEFSAKCGLTGKWIFDYIKHCGINEEFLKDKDGEDIW